VLLAVIQNPNELRSYLKNKTATEAGKRRWNPSGGGVERGRKGTHREVKEKSEEEEKNEGSEGCERKIDLKRCENGECLLSVQRMWCEGAYVEEEDVSSTQRVPALFAVSQHRLSHFNFSLQILKKKKE